MRLSRERGPSHFLESCNAMIIVQVEFLPQLLLVLVVAWIFIMYT